MALGTIAFLLAGLAGFMAGGAFCLFMITMGGPYED